MCAATFIPYEKQVDMHLTLPTWLEAFAIMLTTYNKHELKKPLPKNYVTLNLKFKSTKNKANMNNIVFIHLIISILINKHYN
jgi:hypothetical protein